MKSTPSKLSSIQETQIKTSRCYKDKRKKRTTVNFGGVEISADTNLKMEKEIGNKKSRISKSC